MSHFWRKPLNVAATLAVVLGMAGFSAAAVSAHTSVHHNAKARGTVIYSDYESANTLNIFLSNANGVAAAEINSYTDPFGIEPFYNNKTKLIPAMFTNIPNPTNHGKTYNFHLRKGMHWSDGAPIIGRDLLFAWHVLMNPKTGPYCAGTCDVIKSISLHGKYGITFKLKSVYSVFIQQALPSLFPSTFKKGWNNMGTKAQIAACVKKISNCDAIGTKLISDTSFDYTNDHYITSGPYQITSFSDAGNINRVSFKPNKQWHNWYVGAKAVRPIKTLIFQSYGSQPDMIAAAASHSTDVTTDYTLVNLPQLKANKGKYKIQTFGSNDFEALFFNDFNKIIKGGTHGIPAKTRNPIDNAKVRLALGLSFDRAALIANVLSVSHKVASRFVSYTVPVMSAKAHRSSYADLAIRGAWDPLKHKYVKPNTKAARKDAKKLLKQAGFAGAKVYISTNCSNPARQASVTYLASSKAWGAIGVKVVPNCVSAQEFFFTDLLSGGHYEVAIHAYTNLPDYPDWAYFLLGGQFCPQLYKNPNGNDQNDSCIRNKTLDHAYVAAQHTTSFGKRHKAFDTAQSVIAKEAYWIALYERAGIQTNDGKVKNLTGDASVAGEANWDPWVWSAA